MDNAIVIAVPGRWRPASPTSLFWGSLALSLAVAFVVAFPVNRWLVARGLGHATLQEHHHG